MSRAGLRTTEFWSTLVTQAIAVLTLLGIVNSSDANPLRDALTQCVTAGGIFLANAWVVVRYIQSRTHLKTTMNFER
jgi:hypothetical protein